MPKNKTIHWYIGPRCNASPRCTYCFEQDILFSGDPANKNLELNSPANLRRIARRLNEFRLERVILGGGEPLLVSNLWEVLNMLRGHTLTEVHTNGILLYQNQDRVNKLKDNVDSIALPLDSFNPQIQRQLRSYNAIQVFESVFGLLLKDKRTELGIHTVATTANLEDISEFYKGLKSRGFDFWKIYEMNAALAFSRLISSLDTVEGYNQFLDLVPRIRQLAGLPKEVVRGNMFRSYDFARRVLDLEKTLETSRDQRVKVVLLDDHPEDYLFLNNAGEVMGYSLRSPDDVSERTVFGNIFYQDLDEIISSMEYREIVEDKDRVRFHAQAA